MSRNPYPESQDHGPQVVARLVCGLPVEHIESLELGFPYRDLAAAIQSHAESESAAQVLERELARLPTDLATQVQMAIWAVDPETGAGLPRPAVEDSPRARLVPLAIHVPPLPTEACLSAQAEQAACRVGRLMDDFSAYLQVASPRSPQIFHQGAALWVGGLAIARRLRLRLAHGDVFPNFYALLIAFTTLFAKSTTLNIMLRLVYDALPHLLLSNESTPEALMADLSGQEPTGIANLTAEMRQLWNAGRNFAAQRGIVLDEASALFAGLRRDYLAGLNEMLLRLYDAPSLYRRQTRAGGIAIVRSAALSLFGATTPKGLKQARVTGSWENGLLARFVLLTPDRLPVWSAPTSYLAPPPELITVLQRLSNELLPVATWPAAPSVRDVSITADAFAAWQAYDRALAFDLLIGSDAPDERLWGNYGRLATQALKAALILTALDWATGDQAEPQITLGHWARAQALAEEWRASAHRLLAMLDQGDHGHEMEDHVLELLGKSGEAGMTVREMYRGLHASRETVEQLLFGLTRDGIVERLSRPSAKADRFRLVSRAEGAP